jgi:hypothetical protein
MRWADVLPRFGPNGRRELRKHGRLRGSWRFDRRLRDRRHDQSRRGRLRDGRLRGSWRFDRRLRDRRHDQSRRGRLRDRRLRDGRLRDRRLRDGRLRDRRLDHRGDRRNQLHREHRHLSNCGLPLDVATRECGLRWFCCQS